MSEKKYKSKNAEYGAQGGKISRGGGFAYMKKHNPERLREISRKGRSVTLKKDAGGQDGSSS